eukprot:scaffold61948_cov33-Tisochrysis_lutea.AAC.4
MPPLPLRLAPRRTVLHGGRRRARMSRALPANSLGHSVGLVDIVAQKRLEARARKRRRAHAERLALCARGFCWLEVDEPAHVLDVDALDRSHSVGEGGAVDARVHHLLGVSGSRHGKDGHPTRDTLPNGLVAR